MLVCMLRGRLEPQSPTRKTAHEHNELKAQHYFSVYVVVLTSQGRLGFQPILRAKPLLSGRTRHTTCVFGCVSVFVCVCVCVCVCTRVHVCVSANRYCGHHWNSKIVWNAECSCFARPAWGRREWSLVDSVQAALQWQTQTHPSTFAAVCLILSDFRVHTINCLDAKMQTSLKQLPFFTFGLYQAVVLMKTNRTFFSEYLLH